MTGFNGDPGYPTAGQLRWRDFAVTSETTAVAGISTAAGTSVGRDFGGGDDNFGGDEFPRPP